MNIKTMPAIVQKGANFIVANRPEILAAGSLVGLLGTAYFSGKAALEINKAMGDEKITLEQLKEKETLITLGKIVFPAAACTLFTGGCIVGSQVLHHQQYGALMAAYMMGKDKMKQFESKAIEVLGEGEVDKVRAEIAQQRVLMNPVTSGSGMVIDTGNGNTLCLDVMSGRYFKSSVEAIRRAQNDTNEQINGDWSATLNEWYTYLGLQTIKLGDDLGWNSNNLLKVVFDSALTSSGEPVLVLDYEVYPEYRLL